MKDNEMKRFFSVRHARILIVFIATSLSLLVVTSFRAYPQEIIGLWHFDEIFTDSSGVKTTPDSSSHSNTGTLMPLGSAPLLATGKFGSAISFSGIDQWVDCGATVDDSINTELTLEAWINYDGDPRRYLFILSNDYTLGTKKGYDFFLWPGYGGSVFADIGTLACGRVHYAMPFDSEWHHVLATWDGSTVKLYVDGNLVASFPLSGTYFDPGKDTYIGKFNFPGYAYYPNGMIDEVRIYNYALPEDMIENHASGYYEYSIDIKPGSDPNSINLGEQGKLPVAILGSLDLDVTQIDPATIMLGDAGLATRGKAAKLAYSFEDVNEDGYTDLVAHFNVQELGLTETTTSLTLIANLFGGLGINGTDSVRIVPPQ